MKERHKQQKDENFPVAFRLFPKRYRKMVNCYYDFARQADDIADAPDLLPKEKSAQLDMLENVLYGEKNFPTAYAAAAKLREMFLAYGFDFSLATALLTAFRQDAQGFKYQTWAQLVNYCQYSAAPVGRFLLALYNESPSTYQPASILCTVLQIVNHLQDAGYDAKILKRVYFPEKILHKYKVSESDLVKAETSPSLRRAADNLLARVEKQLEEAAVLPKVIKSIPLRIETFVIINLTKIMITKLKKKDFLAEEIKLSRYDWIVSSMKGTMQGIFTRPRTLSTKGI